MTTEEDLLHPAFDKDADMYNGNMFLNEYIPAPDYGFYYLDCMICGGRDSWSFEHTSPAMWVDHPIDDDSNKLFYPLSPWVCDKCKWTRIDLTPKPKQKLPYSEYLKTEHWQKVRLEALDRARMKCQTCGSKNKLDVHHNTYKNLWRENPCDVIALCRRCHETFHEHRKAQELK